MAATSAPIINQSQLVQPFFLASQGPRKSELSALLLRGANAMSMRHLVVPSVALVVLGAAAWVADAQTGPTGPVGSGKGTKGTGPSGPVGGQALTADRAASLLQAKGYQAQVSVAPNGAKNVIATIEQGGWRYDVTIAFTTDGKYMDFGSPLSAPGQTFTQAQLQGLLQKNMDLIYNVKSFAFNKNDHRLWLMNVNYSPNTSEQQFYQILDDHLSTIRGTYDLWKGQ
jgi:hypothetical protein